MNIDGFHIIFIEEKNGGKDTSYLSKSIQTQIKSGKCIPNFYLRSYRSKNQSVWLESGWLECEVSRTRYREGIIEHKDSTLISDHREEITLAQ